MSIEELDSCLQCQFKEKSETSSHYCKVHQVPLKFPRWTTCDHFVTQLEPNHHLPVKPSGPLFRAGLYEDKLVTFQGEPFQGYPLIPWHNHSEPNIYAKGSCLECGKTFSSGIEIHHQNESLKFCGNAHYLQWWKRQHPQIALSWDYEWKFSRPSQPTSKEKMKTTEQNIFGKNEQEFLPLFDDPLFSFEKEDSETQDNEASEGLKIVEDLLEEAIHTDVTEIHLACYEKEFLVFFRRDGVLNEAHHYPKKYFRQIVSRYKILANLDIAERRVPQEGSFQWGSSIRFFLKTFPTYREERLVLECVHFVQPMLILDDLGFTPKNLGFFTSAFYKKQGLILHCGPSASGKKTAIYATLEERASPQTLIFTIESSIKQEMLKFQQSQINLPLGLTYSNLLHHAAKQHPHILYVEKIVDRETLETAIETALTGILVLASIPAFSTIQVIQRLYQLEIDPVFLVATLRAVVAHQLVRKLCLECRKPHSPSPEQQKIFSAHPEIDLSTLQLYQPGSCDYCYHSGYRGQLGIQEVLLLDESLREKIVRKAPIEEIYSQAVTSGMKTLWQDALFKAKTGETTLEEVFRQIPRDPY